MIARSKDFVKATSIVLKFRLIFGALGRKEPSYLLSGPGEPAQNALFFL